jgi:MFS family permease
LPEIFRLFSLVAFYVVSQAAFLTVAAGTVTDLFAPAHIQAPMMLFTISPFIGPTLGPLLGGFINQFGTWRWTFYILLIWSAVMLACVIIVPETYHPVLLARKSAALRESTGNPAYKSASELANTNKSIPKAIQHSIYKPFQLLFLEPMVLCLCIYSALLLGILYLFFGAFPLVFRSNHGFELWQTGLTFLGLAFGQILGMFSNPFWRWNYLRLVQNWKERQSEESSKVSSKPDPELRLPPAITGGVLVPIGLFVGFSYSYYTFVYPRLLISF